MHVSRISLVAAMLSVGAAPVFASPKPPTTKTHGPSSQTTGSRPTIPTQTTHGNPHTTPTHGSPKTTATTHGNPHKTAAAAPTASGSTPGTSSTTAATSPTSTTTTTATPPPLNPIAKKISSNPGLQPKVNALLPTGMALNQASLGFKNQGQFIAALHVSRNLGIPFADLKTAMTGIRPTTMGTTAGATTGSSTTPSQTTISLGQAIQKLRPSANAESAETTAEHQATVDLSVTAPATTTTAPRTTTTTPKKKNGK